MKKYQEPKWDEHAEYCHRCGVNFRLKGLRVCQICYDTLVKQGKKRVADQPMTAFYKLRRDVVDIAGIVSVVIAFIVIIIPLILYAQIKRLIKRRQ